MAQFTRVLMVGMEFDYGDGTKSSLQGVGKQVTVYA
jgi:hypothetical protein